MIDEDPVEARAELLAENILKLGDEKTPGNPGLLLYALCIGTAKLIRRLAHDQEHAAVGVNYTAIDLADRVNELFGPHHEAGNA
jgi:hypothetical protein